MLKAFNLLEILWDYDIIVTIDMPSLVYYSALYSAGKSKQKNLNHGYLVGVMGCGSTSSSQNITFIEQSSISDPSSFTAGCQYTICPCSSDVCRIRFDFTTLVLADPKTDTTANSHGASTGDAASDGDCITDTFQIIG